MLSITMSSLYKSFLLLSIVASVRCAVTTCKDGWTAYRGSCYLFAMEQDMDFVEAQHFCTQRHANLVEINDVHENNFVVDFLKHMKAKNWWIGLSDQEIEGEYKWVGSDSYATYFNWGVAQPDGDPEDCTELYSDQQFSWHDATCSTINPPICEMPSQGCGAEVIG